MNSSDPFIENRVKRIKASPDFMVGIKACVAALRAGKITLWEDLPECPGCGLEHQGSCPDPEEIDE